MSKSDENLVYDCEHGWFDPEHPIESLGIECEETRFHWIFRQFGQHLVTITRSSIRDPLDFAKIRLCVDDAEARYRA